MERCQDFSVLRLHDVLLECRDDVSRRRYEDVPLDVSTIFSNKSQMKHPTTFQVYDTKTSQWYVSKTSH